MSKRYRSLRGTRDLLPDEVARWHWLESTARDVFRRFVFREIRTPLLEETALFARSVGETSDIVRKEMYTLERGGDSITLRPESTASVVRALVEHALHRNIAAGYPERYFYIGPMFRHERPQRGRQRQFHQIGAEVLGAAEARADAETMHMVELFLDELGIDDRRLVVNSVGDDACRPRYRAALSEWLGQRLDKLCADCRRRATENPLRVFDCKIERDQRLLAEAPTPLQHLCAACTEHFEETRRALDAYGVAHDVDSRLVRGLDYYQRTVFEVVAGGLGAQNAILGGGRYDGLVAELGGPPIPGVGFAMGMERIVMLLPQDRGRERGVDLALVLLGDEGLDAGAALAARLRRTGLEVLAPLIERPLGAQMKRADKCGARFAVFVGKDEIAQGCYGVKDLRSGEQVTLDEAALVRHVEAAHD